MQINKNILYYDCNKKASITNRKGENFMNYEQYGDDIVRLIGGVDNIKQLNHCVTRLRFNLIDDSKADTEAIKALKGVFGVVNVNNQYQVVVGGEVVPTYKAIMKKYNFAGRTVEAEETKVKQPFTIKNVGKEIIDYLSGTMVQIIPIFIACGLINVSLSVATLGFGVETTSSTYILLQSIGNSVFYFLPVFAAFAAAKKVNCNPFLAVISVIFLVHPNFVGLKTFEGATTLFGLEFNALTYTSTLFPALISTFVLSKIEDRIYNFFPAMIRSVFGPFVCLVIMAFANVFVFAPIGYYIGSYIVQFIIFVQDILGPFAVGILGAVKGLLVMVGAHALLVPTSTSLIAEIGYDSFVRPGFIVNNFAIVGAALAVATMSKKKDFKAVSLSASLTSFLGTDEPALYGILLPLKKPFIASLIGGFAGGTVAGLLGVKAYAASKNGVWAFMVFQETIVQMMIAAFVAFAVAFVVTRILKIKEDSQ